MPMNPQLMTSAERRERMKRIQIETAELEAKRDGFEARRDGISCAIDDLGDELWELEHVEDFVKRKAQRTEAESAADAKVIGEAIELHAKECPEARKPSHEYSVMLDLRDGRMVELRDEKGLISRYSVEGKHLNRYSWVLLRS